MDYGRLNDALLKGSNKTLFYACVVPINSMGQVLLGERKSDGIWTTPCGGSQLSETPEQTAIREAWEEAGLAIPTGALEPLGVKMAPNGKPVHCFLVRTNQTNFSVKMDPDREVASWNWYSREQLPDGLSRQKNANRLETISQALMRFFGLSKSEDKSVAHWTMVGTKVEMEHTKDREKAKKIAKDHLAEDPDYYKDWDAKEKILFQEKAPKLDKACNVISLIDKLEKGGPGSGVKGHVTPKKHALHLVQGGPAQPEVNKIQAHLDMLKNGGAIPGVKTASGKPVMNDIEQARAQKYDLQDYVDAMNIHYKMAQKVNTAIEKMRMAGKEPPKEGLEIAKFHEKKMKDFMGARDRLEHRQKELNEAIDSKKKKAVDHAKKSVTQMGSGLGDRDLDIGSFAQAHDKANAEWLEKLHSGMDNFQFGDNPRDFTTSKGVLHLCKVDDGLYSGHFTGEDAGMLDNAKVRIERMTIPELVQFMTAKEWIRDHSVAETEAPKISSDQAGMAYAAAMDRAGDAIQLQEDQSDLRGLIHKLENPQEAPRPFDLADRLRMLELISKLLS